MARVAKGLDMLGDERRLLRALALACYEAVCAERGTTKRGRPHREAIRPTNNRTEAAELMARCLDLDLLWPKSGPLRQAIDLATARLDEAALALLAARVQRVVYMRALYREVDEAAKQPQATISHSGVPLALPATAGAQRRGADGRYGAYQRGLWWELNWDEFHLWLARQRAAGETQLAKVERLGAVASLQAYLPFTHTPHEALALLGLDPDHFAVEDLGPAVAAWLDEHQPPATEEA